MREPNGHTAPSIESLEAFTRTWTMEDFASDTDSDYTSYWRDWVSLGLSSFGFTGGCGRFWRVGGVAGGEFSGLSDGRDGGVRGEGGG